MRTCGRDANALKTTFATSDVRALQCAPVNVRPSMCARILAGV